MDNFKRRHSVDPAVAGLFPPGESSEFRGCLAKEGEEDRMTEPSRLNGIPDRMLTVEEVGQILNFSPRTVREKAKRKQIPFVRIGRTMRFHPDAIRAFLDAAGKDQ